MDIMDGLMDRLMDFMEELLEEAVGKVATYAYDNKTLA